METLDPGDCTRGQEVFLTHEGVAHHGGNEAGESRKVVSSSKSTSVTSAAGGNGATGGFSGEGRHFRIRELGRKLRAAARRAQVQAEENMLRELQEAAQLGAKAKVHRLCVQLARNGRGVKGRRYTHVAAASPSIGESKKWLESPAEEGGRSAKILEDYDSEVRKVLSCFEPSAPADLNRETAARNDLRDTLRFLKRGPKRKSCPEWSAPAELLIMALDPRYYAVRDSIPHGVGCDATECTKLTKARNTLLKVLVQVRCADGGNGATPYLAHLSRGVTLDKGNKKSGVKALRLIHMFCTWWKAFFGAALRRSLRDQPVSWDDAFHGYITGRRRKGAMITQRLRQEGIQHLTDFEDMSNAFACTRANCRAEVLEELINEVDRPMFFERILNSTVLYESDEERFFATPQCGNFMGSSEGPIFFLAAYASPLLRWN